VVLLPPVPTHTHPFPPSSHPRPPPFRSWVCCFFFFFLPVGKVPAAHDGGRWVLGPALEVPGRPLSQAALPCARRSARAQRRCHLPQSHGQRDGAARGECHAQVGEARGGRDSVSPRGTDRQRGTGAGQRAEREIWVLGERGLAQLPHAHLQESYWGGEKRGARCPLGPLPRTGARLLLPVVTARAARLRLARVNVALLIRPGERGRC